MNYSVRRVATNLTYPIPYVGRRLNGEISNEAHQPTSFPQVKSKTGGFKMSDKVEQVKKIIGKTSEYCLNLDYEKCTSTDCKVCMDKQIDALYTERAGENPTPMSEDKIKEIDFWQWQARVSTHNDINEMLKPTGLSIGMIMQGSKLVEYILCDEDGDSIPLIEFGEELRRNAVRDDSQPDPPAGDL